MDSRVRTIVRAFSLLELSNSLEIVRRCARPTFIVVLFQSERARERENSSVSVNWKLKRQEEDGRIKEHRSEVRAGTGPGKMTDTKWLLYQSTGSSCYWTSSARHILGDWWLVAQTFIDGPPSLRIPGDPTQASLFPNVFSLLSTPERDEFFFLSFSLPENRA